MERWFVTKQRPSLAGNPATRSAAASASAFGVQNAPLSGRSKEVAQMCSAWYCAQSNSKRAKKENGS